MNDKKRRWIGVIILIVLGTSLSLYCTRDQGWHTSDPPLPLEPPFDH